MQKRIHGVGLLALQGGTTLGNVGSHRRKQCVLDRELLDACSSKKDQPDRVKGLLFQGASLKATDRYKWTPLMNASFHGLVNSVWAIMEFARSEYTHDEFVAYLRQKDESGGDACDSARLHRHKNWQVIGLLTKPEPTHLF